MIRSDITAVAFILMLFSSTTSAAFPDRYIRFMVPFAPGGATDYFSRVLATNMSEILGQKMVIENQAGANGNIGTATVARATPNGYTIGFAHMSILAMNPHLDANRGFDPLQSFSGVANLVKTQWVLVIPSSMTATNVKEFIAHAKSSPGKLSFAANATTGQILGEIFKLTTGTNMLYVPYTSISPMLIDLFSGTVNMLITGTTATLPHIKAGRLRPLIIVGTSRDDAIPNVPTAQEESLPDLALTGWFGLIAPARTPQEAISKLHSAAVRALGNPDVREKLKVAGMEISLSSPQEFDQFIRSEHSRWGNVIKAVTASGVELRQ